MPHAFNSRVMGEVAHDRECCVNGLLGLVLVVSAVLYEGFPGCWLEAKKNINEIPELGVDSDLILEETEELAYSILDIFKILFVDVRL